MDGKINSIFISLLVNMRQRSKPSTVLCNSILYTLFLLAEPKYVSCVRLAEILAEVSHDSINRFLLRERYTPRDLFAEVSSELILSAGTLSIDDSVEDKPYRDQSKSAFVDFFWSGKLANNRKVSVERGTSLPVKALEIPDEGLMVYLKAFGWVKVFCQPFKNEPRYYILYQPDLAVLQPLTRSTFKTIHDDHWKIKCFHRVIKQVCNIEHFHVRDQHAIRNHFFCALRAFYKLQTMFINRLINNCYEPSRQLFVPVIRQFILENLTEAAFV